MTKQNLFFIVIFNLMDNVIRYGVGATVIRFHSHQSGTDLILSCEDDGVGVPDDVKERIFEQGYGNNTGQGLFLVREILAITGISITETGVYGQGARFDIRVPQDGYGVLRRKEPHQSSCSLSVHE